MLRYHKYARILGAIHLNVNEIVPATVLHLPTR
jgi:hypothetical protein